MIKFIYINYLMQSIKDQDNPVKTKQQSNQSNGSLQQKTVNIIFVGAGPATLGLICNAQKTSRLRDLITQDGGIAILEKGQSFGGGMLQYYGINSNTSSNGFLKCAFKKKTLLNDDSQNGSYAFSQKSYKSHINRSNKKGTNSDLQEVTSKNSHNSDDDNAIDSERDEPETGDTNTNSHASLTKRAQKIYSYQGYEPFKELVESELFKHMSEYGTQIIPLSMVGIFMNFVGNHLLYYIFQQFKSKVFFGKHKVVSIQLLANGEFITMAARKMKFEKKDQVSGKVQIVEQEQLIQFRSRAVVVSNGGKQSLHPSFYKSWFPFMKAKKDKVLLSDKFMRRDIYKQTMDRIQTNKLKNIVIIGGSASGWSSAWLLLNGPATYYKNNSIKLNQRTKFPQAKIKSIQNCKDCCKCLSQKKGSCPCDCLCFGRFAYSDWEFDYSTLPKHFENGSIKILYRDKIKVFYSSVAQGKADGYTEYDPKIFSRKDGYLYSYTGIRGNAKNLYKKVKNGNEKRIKLIQTPTPQDQAKYVDAADLVIWSCGYQTNKIMFKDHEGKEIPMSQRVLQTQFDVDAQCRIVTADGSILTKTFGTGIAYPTRTNDGMQISDGKAKPRADSFSLYCNWVANRVLLQLFQNNLLSSKIQRTIRTKQQQIQEQQKQQDQQIKQLKKLRVKSVANLAINKLKKDTKDVVGVEMKQKQIKLLEVAQSQDSVEINIDSADISVPEPKQNIAIPQPDVKIKIQRSVRRESQKDQGNTKYQSDSLQQQILKIENLSQKMDKNIIEKQIIQDINSQYNKTGQQHRKLKKPATAKRRRDKQDPSFDVFDNASKESGLQYIQSPTKSNIQSLSDIGKMASSGSQDQQMTPYYSPDESEDIADLLDNTRGKSATSKNIGGLLPDLVDSRQNYYIMEQRSQSSAQNQREQEYYGNAVKNPVLKPLASPTRKQLQAKQAGRPDYEANYLGKIQQKSQAPKVNYQQFMPKNLTNQSPEKPPKKSIFKNKGNLRDVNKNFIEQAVKEQKQRKDQQKKKVQQDASKTPAEASFAPQKNSKITTTPAGRKKPKEKPLIETPFDQGPPTQLQIKDPLMKAEKHVIQTISPKIQKHKKEQGNAKNVEIQILEPTDTNDENSPKTPKIQKYQPIQKNNQSPGGSRQTSPIKIVNDSIELRGSALIQEQEMKIFEQRQNQQAQTPRVLKKSLTPVNDYDQQMNKHHQTPQTISSKFTPKVIDIKSVPGVKLTLQSQNRATNYKTPSKKQQSIPLRSDSKTNQRVNDLVKNALKGSGPSSISQLKDAKPILSKNRSKQKYRELKSSVHRKNKLKSSVNSQVEQIPIIRPQTSFKSKDDDNNVALRYSPPRLDNSPDGKEQWVSMVSVIVTEKDDSEIIDLSPNTSPQKSSLLKDHINSKMNKKKQGEDSPNIYSALGRDSNSEFLGVQMFEKGSASSGSRRQSIIQTLSKQELSAREQKKMFDQEMRSKSPHKPTISKYFFHQKAQPPQYIEEYQTAKSHRKQSPYQQSQPMDLNQGNCKNEFISPQKDKKQSSSKLFSKNIDTQVFNSAPRHRANLNDTEEPKVPGSVNDTLINDINKVASKEIEEHYKIIRNQNEQQVKKAENKAVQKTNKGIKISLQKIIKQREEEEQKQLNNQRVELSDNYYLDSVLNRQDNQDEQANGQSDRINVTKKPSMGTLLKEPGAKKPWSRKSLDELKKNIINQIKDLKKNNQDRFELLKEKQQGD